MSRALASALCLFVITVSTPARAEEACVLEGRGEVRDVIPQRARGMRIHLDELLRIRLDGNRATVEGLDPIALEGTAALSGLRLHLRESVVFQGVLFATKNAPLHVLEARGRAVRVRPAIEGLLVSATEMGCDLLSLERDNGESTDEEAPDDLGWAFPRTELLRISANAKGGRGVVLRSERASKLSLREIGFGVLEKRGSRIRVRADLSWEYALEGWVDASSVSIDESPTGFPSGARGEGCGYAFGGTMSYRGPATVKEGAELFDEGGRPFARVVRDTAATVVVWNVHWKLASIDSIEGIAKNPCKPTTSQVAFESLVIRHDGVVR